LFDRYTGKPLFDIEEHGVAQSEVPGAGVAESTASGKAAALRPAIDAR
jgi:hypothetical protein